MIRKFNGIDCAYCSARPAVTFDHVFARKFFLVAQRGDLPKVPACSQCNGAKSTLEQYLMTVLPFGGRHADALANLSNMVPSRLQKNRKLHRQIARNASRTWIRTESGLRVQTMALHIEPERLIELFRYIVRGLLYHHWNVRVLHDHFLDVMLLARGGQRVLDGFMQMNAKDRVRRNLGSGTFTYDGVQGLDNDAISMWRFSVYGDITLAGDPRSTDEEVVQIGAFTGPKYIADKVALRERLTAPMSLAVW